MSKILNSQIFLSSSDLASGRNSPWVKREHIDFHASRNMAPSQRQSPIAARWIKLKEISREIITETASQRLIVEQGLWLSAV